MTSSIGLLSVFADVVLLLALTWAVASARLSQLARSVIATLVFTCAWLTTAASEAIRAPGWTVFLGAAVTLLSIGAVTITLHLWTQGGDGGQSGPGHGGGNGGGGPRRHRPDAPQAGGGDSDPSWWPEFERQLTLYVTERGAEQRQVC
jgi:hypothetical protein